MKKTYPQLVKYFTENALLHLYMRCEDEKRFVPLKRRNEWLVQYLKPFIKNDEYRPLRKDIKTLIIGGRKNTANIEQQLIRLLSLVDTFDNDVEHFYSLLSQLEDNLSLPSSIFDKDKPAQEHHIYVLGEHVDSAFTKEGLQVAPLALVVNSSRWQKIEAEVDQHGHFVTEVSDSTDMKATIFLHPKSRNISQHKVA